MNAAIERYKGVRSNESNRPGRKLAHQGAMISQR